MNSKELAGSVLPQLKEWRHYLHAHPELTGKEVNTVAYVEKELRLLGITDIVKMKTCCGLTADIIGEKGPGRTLAIRADMDALPVEEETGLPFASQVPGVMHACGHDAHTAILLGAAKILNEHRSEFSGRVRLLFQPAEEYPAGAKAMVSEGVMDGVDAVYGNHIWSRLPDDKMDFAAGNKMAAGDIFRINVEGVAAHGSAPNLGADAIVAAAQILTNVQQIVSRQNDPLSPMVVSIGVIDGGTRMNVIPNHVFMEGTCRSFLKGDAMEKLIRKVVEGTAKSCGVDVDYKHIYMTPAVINENEDLNRIAHDAVAKLYGEDTLVSIPPTMGGEDFSFFSEKAPSVFGFIGTYNEAKGYVYNNHQEKFDFDEDTVLPRAVSVMVQFAQDYLN